MGTQGVGTFLINSKFASGSLVFYEKAYGRTVTGDVFTIGTSSLKMGNTSNPIYLWAGDGSSKITFDSVADDFAHFTSALTVTETGTTETDIKNIRVQLSSGEALTGKHLKSIYSRVDVDHAVNDAYCFQGSMRVGDGGTPSLLVYGISQSMVLSPTAYTQLTEARCVYASISGDVGINGTSSVYTGIVSNTDTTHYTTNVYEGGSAAYCKVGSVFAATGQGEVLQVIDVELYNGTPAFIKFRAAETNCCLVAGDYDGGTASYGIRVLIGATPYWIQLYTA